MMGRTKSKCRPQHCQERRGCDPHNSEIHGRAWQWANKTFSNVAWRVRHKHDRMITFLAFSSPFIIVRVHEKIQFSFLCWYGTFPNIIEHFQYIQTILWSQRAKNRGIASLPAYIQSTVSSFAWQSIGWAGPHQAKQKQGLIVFANEVAAKGKDPRHCSAQ